jgi:hypothetical protein
MVRLPGHESLAEQGIVIRIGIERRVFAATEWLSSLTELL